jgi:hypothetical protein
MIETVMPSTITNYTPSYYPQMRLSKYLFGQRYQFGHVNTFFVRFYELAFFIVYGGKRGKLNSIKLGNHPGRISADFYRGEPV